MTPGQRLMKAFELSEFSKQLFIHGLRRRFPEMPEAEFRQLFLKRLAKDALRVYEVQFEKLDLTYMKSWVKLLELMPLWNRLIKEAETV